MATVPQSVLVAVDFSEASGRAVELGGVIDGRFGLIEPTLASTDATLLIVAAPHPRTTAWLSSFGDPFVRHFTVPVLFVPELTQGAM